MGIAYMIKRFYLSGAIPGFLQDGCPVENPKGGGHDREKAPLPLPP